MVSSTLADSATTAAWYGAWGQWVSAIVAVLALVVSVVVLTVTVRHNRRQDEAIARQLADSKRAVDAQIEATERTFNEIRAEAARRDQEIKLLRDEAKRREAEWHSWM